MPLLHTVHVDHLKHCYAFEGKDNWVINPQYVPKDHPRLHPKDKDTELDEILSQEGEDNIDREDYPPLIFIDPFLLLSLVNAW